MTIKPINLNEHPNLPWLVVGKGPSAERVYLVDIKKYNVIGLNQASAELPATIGHFIDYEAFVDCGGKLAPQIWMPFVPHWRERTGYGTIETYLQYDPNLRWLQKQDRLRCYNLFGSKEKMPGPDVYANCTSLEAVIHILWMGGVRKIHTLGIDGGTQRAPRFEDDYRYEHKPYDSQKEYIDDLCRVLSMEIVKL